MELAVEFTFSAAHRLPYYDGPCFRVHGHNYRLQVTVEGQPDARSGMLMDFEELGRLVKANLLDAVDHQLLNDFMDNPTAENVVVWAWRRLGDKLPGLKELRLWENANYAVSYRGD